MSHQLTDLVREDTVMNSDHIQSGKHLEDMEFQEQNLKFV